MALRCGNLRINDTVQIARKTVSRRAELGLPLDLITRHVHRCHDT